MPTYSTKPDAFQQKTIVITGASDGIGRQAALSYAEHGANLVLLGRSTTKLKQLSSEIEQSFNTKNWFYSFDFDTATDNDYQDLAKQIETHSPTVDGLLHSAGLLGELTPLTETDMASFDQLFRVNVRSNLRLTQVLWPLLERAPAARILFTSSTVGHQGRALWGNYAISKFAVEGMMQVLADETKNTPIRVNAINPGATRTAMRAQAKPQEDPGTLKTPLDIMPLYLYLMSPEMQDTHGQCLDAQPK
ncbi:MULTISPECIES: YciK family oxidoreductase [unclassified Vibrio]|uniref:YciK family oxidoreductase n=1 Tax=Vibrio sp. HB236076 TaxID=3232307 RepID=A0AB39H9X0_9VIBR|nr:YciK family oxidoreductase [Vibrio sp. HB161653]MDP5253680.1 YciK family oxidoreductase [Vibrio sp. HB161653]